MESNELKLMVGDWVERLCREKIKVTPDYLVYIENYPDRYPKPIPLTPDLLDSIDGIIVYEFDNGKPNQYRLGDRLFVIRDSIIVDYGSDLKLPHLHTLQQLIRLFTGKEIVVKWEK